MTVCVEHVIKPWPQPSELCWPWGPWSLASWYIPGPRVLLPRDSRCPGPGPGYSSALPGSRPSRMRSLYLRARVMNVGSSSSGAKQGLGSLGAHKKALHKLPQGYQMAWRPGKGTGKGSEGVVLKGARVLGFIITVAQEGPDSWKQRQCDRFVWLQRQAGQCVCSVGPCQSQNRFNLWLRSQNLANGRRDPSSCWLFALIPRIISHQDFFPPWVSALPLLSSLPKYTQFF